RISGDDCVLAAIFRQLAVGHFRNIQPQIRFTSASILSVTSKAILRKNRSHVPIVAHDLGQRPTVVCGKIRTVRLKRKDRASGYSPSHTAASQDLTTKTQAR